MFETRRIQYNITASNQTTGPFAALKRDLGDVSTRTAILGGNMRAFFGGLAGGAAVAAVTQAGRAFVRLSQDIESLGDSSETLGDTVEAISGLEDLARRNGGGLETVNLAVGRLNKLLSDAKTGSAQADALKSIGLSAAELRRQSPVDALETVAKALARYADDGAKARLESLLFGKSSKELAGFLKDLAEQGRGNASSTGEQVEAAKKFNRQLDDLATNVGNVGRSIVADMLPRLSDLATRFEKSRKDGDLLLDTLKAIRLLTSPGALAVNKLLDIPESAEVDRLRQIAIGLENIKRADQEAGRPENEANSRRLRNLNAQIAALERATTLAQVYSNEGRNYPKLIRPSVGDPADKPDKARKQASEAQRYLESLQKQGEKLEELTTYEQALRDIQAKRLEGLTPKLEAQIKSEAQLVDLRKLWTRNTEASAEAEKKLNAEIEREKDATRQLFDSSTEAQLRRLDADRARMRNFLSDPGNQGADAGRAALDVLDKLDEARAQILGLESDGAKAAAGLADVFEKSMDRATDAVLDFAVEGKGSIADIGKAFARDVLRAMIEDPVRDTMKRTVQIIRDSLNSLQVDNPLSSLVSLLGLFGGTGSAGVGITNSATGSLVELGLGAGRANGGRARAGRLLRVNENGTEAFIPDTDGTIVSGSQLARASAAGGVIQNNYVTVNGDVGPATVRLVEQMLARNNARLARSMRTGGAFAAG